MAEKAERKSKDWSPRIGFGKSIRNKIQQAWKENQWDTNINRRNKEIGRTYMKSNENWTGF